MEQIPNLIEAVRTVPLLTLLVPALVFAVPVLVLGLIGLAMAWALWR